ncbi:MAG: hypothetical protein ACE5JD_18015, partial [Candidatus Methylomirabilia bacterium]
VMGKLLALDEALRPALPAFLSLLDAPVEDPHWQDLDPPQRRERTLDAIKRLLLRESQVQPLCLVFEDLHWIDSETQAFLDSLVESLPTARLLFLVNYRPEYEHHWGSKTYYTQLRIDPLPPESAEELLQGLVGKAAELHPFRQLLIERTEGNPFFLEESVRTLVETQVLVGERGAYRLAKPVQTIQVPATVQAVLAARIDRLTSEEKHLLQAASVIGKDVPFPLLHAIAELPEEVVRQGLAHLQAAEFLYETSLFPELEYTFKHALTHEVTYRRLLHERRRALHAQIVTAIEALYADRLVEQVERLAHHAFSGERWEQAVAYLRQAGEKAMDRSAYREAAAWFQRALDALEHLPPSREITEAGVDLRIQLRRVLYPIGENSQIFAYLREAEDMARLLNDQPRLGWVSAFLAQNFYLRGDYRAALDYGHRALDLAAAGGDSDLGDVTGLYLGVIYWLLGEYRQAINFLKQSAQSLEGDRARERLGLTGFPSVFARLYLAWCEAELGELSEAIAHAEDALAIAEGIGQPFTRMVAHFGRGRLSLFTGEIEEAMRSLEPALLLSETANVRGTGVATALGLAYARAGRITDALRLVEQTAAHDPAWSGPSEALQMVWEGEAYLHANRVDDAGRVARAALDLYRERAERGNMAWVLRLLGEIAAHQDSPDADAAEGSYREALTIAADLGMRPLLAQCHLGLGKLY